MKTKNELNALKEEVENLNRKLAELNKEELELVTAGIANGRTYWKKRPGADKGNALNDEELPNVD